MSTLVHTLKDRQGNTISPIVSTKTVFDEKGVDLDTLLAQQKRELQDALEDYPNKDDLSTALDKKQNTLTPTEDMQITSDNIIGLTEKFKNSKLDQEVWDERNTQFSAKGILVVPSTGVIGKNPNYDTTDFIPINRNFDIVVSDITVTSNVSAIALYDGTRKFIAGCGVHTASDYIGNVIISGKTYTLKAEDIPSNAVYFRCGSYKADTRRAYSNGPTFESREGAVSEAIAAAKLSLFIDQYNAAFGQYGKYDPVNAPDPQHPFFGNKIWMTYEEAVDIMVLPRIRGDYTSTGTNQFLYLQSRIRTHLPKTGEQYPSKCQYTFMSASNLEVVNAKIIPMELCFYRCRKLREINVHQLIGADTNEARSAYDSCVALTDIYVATMGPWNVSLRWSPLITRESFSRIIAATPNNVTNAGGYTITVHPEVYAKLTDTDNEEWFAVLTAAAEKNISFATV